MQEKSERSPLVVRDVEMGTLSLPEVTVSPSFLPDVTVSPSLSPSSSSLHLRIQEGTQILRAAGESISDRLCLAHRTTNVFCSICRESVARDDCYAFTGGGGCSHLFCRECLCGYLVHSIENGMAFAPCPEFVSEEGCDAVAAEDDVRLLIGDAKVLAKFDRFKKMAERPDWRDCPQCASMQLPTRNLFGRIRPTMVCSECKMHFCFFHAGAHPNETCADFTRRTAREEVVSSSWIKANTKDCPKCSFPTEKNRGCNHLTCAKCRTDWCWRCREDISFKTTGKDVDWHYDPRNVRGCPGSQFTNGNGEFLVLEKLTSYLWFVVFGILMLGFSLVWTLALLAGGLACGCFCCCGCGRFFQENFTQFNSDVVIACFVGPPAALSYFVITVLWLGLGRAAEWPLDRGRGGGGLRRAVEDVGQARASPADRELLAEFPEMPTRWGR